jgi:aryl carrier-like protein
MTIEQAKTRRDEIMANANIGPGQQAAQLMRLQAQLRRLHPGVDLADLG